MRGNASGSMHESEHGDAHRQRGQRDARRYAAIHADAYGSEGERASAHLANVIPPGAIFVSTGSVRLSIDEG